MFGWSMPSALPESNSTMHHRAARARRSIGVISAGLSISLLIGPLGCASSRSGGSSEPGSVEITLGSDGAGASSDELTLDALRAGQSMYTIEGENGTYTVELTEDQIADLIAGSTVMTEASGENGSESVRITVAKASKRGFGW
jgi:hypothetical protein